MKIIGYGTCQIHMIYDKYLQYLPMYEDSFFYLYNQYDLARAKGELPIEDFQTADLFIYNPLSSKYGEYCTDNILQYISKNATIICIPFIYLDMYPFFSSYEKIVSGNSLEKYLDKSKNEIFYLYSIGKLDFNLKERVKHSIERIRAKEINSTIKIADFIEENYKKHRLCTSFCHPSEPIYRHIANQIFEKLKVPIVLDVFEKSGKKFENSIEPDSMYMFIELGLEYQLNYDDNSYLRTLNTWCTQNNIL